MANAAGNRGGVRRSPPSVAPTAFRLRRGSRWETSSPIPAPRGGPSRDDETELRERKVESFHGRLRLFSASSGVPSDSLEPPRTRTSKSPAKPFPPREGATVSFGHFVAGAPIFSIDLTWMPLTPPRTTSVPVTVAGTSARPATRSLDRIRLLLEEHVERAVLRQKARRHAARDARVGAGRVFGVEVPVRDVAMHVDDGALHRHVGRLFFPPEKTAAAQERGNDEQDEATGRASSS